MKKYIVPITLITLTLCGCKGRTASVVESDGDTIEVVVNNAATDGAESADSAVTPATSEYDEPTPRPDAVPAHTESAAEAAGLKSGMTSETAERMPAGDVSLRR